MIIGETMLTSGNTKLGIKILNFNLPRTSCLHKTPACEKYCYARRNFWNVNSVKKSMQSNFDLSKSNNFIKHISAQITYRKIKDGIKYIRIHSSGDFYCQTYFDHWNEIAKEHPDTVFLAYTRNYDIDFSNRADNFKIYFSIDDTTEKVNPTINLKAYVIDKGPVKKHMLKIPETNSFMCDSKCKKCKFCYLSNMNVTFVKH